MARNGKIACLPLEIRTEVNRRLDDGEGGIKLLEWLNGLSEAQAVPARMFGGRPISKQNLYQWRAREYRVWKARNEVWSEARREMAVRGRTLAEDAGELVEAARGRLTDHLATVLAARYAVMLADWNGEVTDEFRGQLRALGELCQDIVALRRGDHNGARLELERERGANGGWKVEDGDRAELRRETGKGSEKSKPVKAGKSQSNQSFFFQARMNTNRRIYDL